MDRKVFLKLSVSYKEMSDSVSEWIDSFVPYIFENVSDIIDYLQVVYGITEVVFRCYETNSYLETFVFKEDSIYKDFVFYVTFSKVTIYHA